MARLSSRQIKEFKSLCKQGSKIEYTYLGRSDSGKVIGSGFMGGVKVSRLTSHVISDQALSSSQYYSKLIVDGKKIIDDNKVVI